MKFFVIIPFRLLAIFLLIMLITLCWLVSGHAQGTRNTFDPLKAFQQLNEGFQKMNNDIASLKKSNDQLLKSTATNIGQNVANDITSALNDFASFVSGDTKNAADLAISNPDTLDGNGQQCWDSLQNASKIFKDNPVPNADIAASLGVASTLERIRLLAMTANNVCQNTACTQVIADASGALAAAAPLKTPVPDLHAICSLIPNVARGKPTRTLPTAPASPEPQPTPSASPSQ